MTQEQITTALIKLGSIILPIILASLTKKLNERSNSILTRPSTVSLPFSLAIILLFFTLLIEIVMMGSAAWDIIQLIHNKSSVIELILASTLTFATVFLTIMFVVCIYYSLKIEFQFSKKYARYPSLTIIVDGTLTKFWIVQKLERNQYLCVVGFKQFKNEEFITIDSTDILHKAIKYCRIEDEENVVSN